uniref:Uncharacterized protein n=1 Tax=Heterorhabditis bacteriophora TaxID=37862 RepID=A0A1I7X8I0_HETBA
MSSSNIMEEIGWKVRGDFEPPESNKRRPFWPRFKQFLEMIPMVTR